MRGLTRNIILIACWLCVISGCRKSEDILFTGAFETRFVIPGGLSTVLTHYITIPNIYTDFVRTSNNAGIKVEEINSIQASYGKINVINNVDDLDFIQDISVTIISRTNPNLKKEMYYSEFVPFTVDQELRLQSGSSELKEIIKEDYIDLEIRFNIRGFVPNSTEVKMDMSFIAL